MFHNLTPKAQQVFVLAKKFVLKFQHKCLGTEHLLLGLLELKQSIAVRVLQKIGLDIDTIHDTLLQHVASGKTEEVDYACVEKISKNSTDVPVTPRVQKVFKFAEKISKDFQHTYIGTEHLLLGLLEEGKGLGARILKVLDIDPQTCKHEILAEMMPNKNDDDDDEDLYNDDDSIDDDFDNDDSFFSLGTSKTKPSILKNFGLDLTQKARNKELDPVIGREKEIQRLIQVLCRRTKNNPVLIGEAGVGKTAVVEGLAQHIVAGKVPAELVNKSIYNLDLALLLSGTKYRGQFEERLKNLMDEVKDSNIILFLDELHTIVGAGSAEGSMDASNILKPVLARGQLQCIGATTLDEYRRYIEKDMALNRRFQAILVEPTSTEDTLKILEGIKSHYEDFHNVRYSDAILEQSVGLAQRYVTDRVFPDKAIDLLDEAGARTKIMGAMLAPSTEALDQAIQAINQKKFTAINDQKFEEAARWRDKEQTLIAERSQLLENWKRNSKTKKIPVKEETLQHIVFDWTGVPIERMRTHKLQQFLNLDKILEERVVGQQEAISSLTRALKRSCANLRDPQRPIGSFMFLGPTGVGKTYLIKILAEQIFGRPEAIVQLDMSEYMEKHTVARLIGSPPGYVGHEDGGQLTEAVRRKPYSIVLFDEIEKAHPDVIQILLQVLEEGHLTDALGRRVDFKNTIIVMTSNVGAQALQKDTGLGFGIPSQTARFEQIQSNVQEALKSAFQPEFLNRIDETIIFRPLTREHMLAIVDLELDKLRKRLAENKVELCLDREAKKFLVDKGFDAKMGARPLRRTIERHVEDALADGLLEGKIKSGQRVTFSLDNNLLRFSSSSEKSKKKQATSKKQLHCKEVSVK